MLISATHAAIYVDNQGKTKIAYVVVEGKLAGSLPGAWKASYNGHEWRSNEGHYVHNFYPLKSYDHWGDKRKALVEQEAIAKAAIANAIRDEEDMQEKARRPKDFVMPPLPEEEPFRGDGVGWMKLRRDKDGDPICRPPRKFEFFFDSLGQEALMALTDFHGNELLCERALDKDCP